MALTFVKKWTIAFGLIVLLTVSSLLALGKAQAQDDLLEGLPFPVVLTERRFSSYGGQLAKAETWSLTDISSEQAQSLLRSRCTAEEGWEWMNLGQHSWQANRNLKGQTVESVVIMIMNGQVVLGRRREYSKLSYAIDWISSGGKLQVLHVTKSRSWFSSFP